MLLKNTLIIILLLFVNIIGHELLHLIFGRVAGIPATFLSLSSVGVPSDYDINRFHSPVSIFLMNVPAFIISFIFGCICFAIIYKKRGHISNGLKFILTWFAIFNIPYLGMQFLTSVDKGSSHGDGPDFAYMASFLNFSDSIRFAFIIIALIFIPLSYYALSRLFYRKEMDASLLRTSLVRKVVASLFFIVALIYSLKSSFDFLVKGILIDGPGSIFLFYLFPVLFAMLLMTDFKNIQKELLENYFYPSLVVGIILLFPTFLSTIDVFSLFFKPIVSLMGDFSIALLLVGVPAIIGMMFFSQYKFPNFKK